MTAVEFYVDLFAFAALVAGFALAVLVGLFIRAAIS